MKQLTLACLALVTVFASQAWANPQMRPAPGNKAMATPMVPIAPTAAKSQAPQYDAPRLNSKQLKPLWDKGQVLVVDVRGKAAYEDEHIKGAISLPFAEVRTRYKEILKAKLAVLYCT